MDPLTEKVARAISKNTRDDDWRLWIEEARAAIRAMFEGRAIHYAYDEETVGMVIYADQLTDEEAAYVIPDSEITAAMEDSNAKP